MYKNSHYHCWDQDVPACGIKKEHHKRCCLCEETMTNNNWEEEFEKLWTIGSIGIQVSFGKFTSAKDIQLEFIKDLLTLKDQEHKAVLEDIKEEIEKNPGFSICSAHQTWNDKCKLCGNATILKEDAVFIVDKYL